MGEKEPKQPVDLYRLLLPIARLALNRHYEVKVINPENILDRPAVYAANHREAVDSPLLIAKFTEYTDIPMRFAVKKGYFEGTGVDDEGQWGRVAKFVIEHTLQVPVERKNATKEDIKIYNEGIKRTFERGESFGIHPEGTRVGDRKLYKFHEGVGRIVMDYHVPAVPVGLVYKPPSNNDKILLEMTFGEPVMPEELEHLPYSMLIGQRNKAAHITHVLEHRVADMTHMKQTHTYAPLGKSKRDHE